MAPTEGLEAQGRRPQDQPVGFRCADVRGGTRPGSSVGTLNGWLLGENRRSCPWNPVSHGTPLAMDTYRHTLPPQVARDFRAARLASPWSLTSLAAEVGISRGHLIRNTERHPRSVFDSGDAVGLRPRSQPGDWARRRLDPPLDCRRGPRPMVTPVPTDFRLPHEKGAMNE